MTQPVAITGLGAVTPVGNDVASTWDSLVAGRSGIGRLTTFQSDSFPVRIAGLVRDFDARDRLPDRRLARHLSRSGGFGVAAAIEALDDAAIPAGTYDSYERGMAMGVSVGRPPLNELAESYSNVVADGRWELVHPAPSAVLTRDPNTWQTDVARLAGCAGPMVSVSTACTASGHALGEAFRHIQEGDARMMLAGGADALTSWLDVLGFSLLGALNDECNDAPEKASRPFDATRSGFVLGEGAVVAVLEDWESAMARGARIYGVLVGYGSSMNAYRMTDAPPDGGGAITCMAGALEEAELAPADIDYVSAHGTSTPGNDASETVAIKAVLGADARRVAISSVKSMTGHLTCAAASLNLLAALCAMRDGVVPPTINLQHPDPKCDLDYVPNVAKRMPVRSALVNAFAFGGTNASLAVSGRSVEPPKAAAR
jgi:3-oxoacyl-[acyl-carrier-protein] synthase II